MIFPTSSLTSIVLPLTLLHLSLIKCCHEDMLTYILSKCWGFVHVLICIYLLCNCDVWELSVALLLAVNENDLLTHSVLSARRQRQRHLLVVLNYRSELRSSLYLQLKKRHQQHLPSSSHLQWYHINGFYKARQQSAYHSCMENPAAKNNWQMFTSDVA